MFDNYIAFHYEGDNVYKKRLGKIVYSQNEVKFHYKSKPDSSETYFAGNKIIDDRLLSSITVKNHRGIAINSYHLTHEQSRTSGRSLVKEIIRCAGSTSSRCLQPTTFEYEDDVDIGFQDEHKEIVVSFRDLGISSTSGSSQINCDFEQENSTYCGSKSIAFGDTNGDGKTEIVVLNGNGSNYKVQAFTPTSNGYIKDGQNKTGPMHVVRERVGTHGIKTFYGAGLTVGETDGDGIDEIIITNAFKGFTGVRDMYADIDGDGLLEAATMYQGNTTSSRYDYLFEGQGKCTDNYAYMEYNVSTHSVTDYNGDGLMDRIMQINGSCIEIDGANDFGVAYELYENTSIGMNFSETLSSVPAPTVENNQTTGDINGDGYEDFTGVGCGTGKGVDLSCFSTHNMPDSSFDGNSIVDINGDGKGDLLKVNRHTKSVKVIYSDPSANGIQERQLTTFNWDMKFKMKPTLIDLDGDGQPAIVFFDKNNQRVHIRHDANVENKKIDTLISVSNGMGAQTELEYAQLSDTSVYTSANGFSGITAGKGSPVINDSPRHHVVHTVTRKAAVDRNGSALFETTQYHYKGLRTQFGGRGSLGFSEIQETNITSGVRNITKYRQDYPFTGQVTQNISQVNVNGTYKTVTETNTTDWHFVEFYSGLAYYLSPAKSTTKQYTFSGLNGQLGARTLVSESLSESHIIVLPGNYVVTDSTTSTMNDMTSNLSLVSTASFQFDDEDVYAWFINRPTSSVQTKRLYSGSTLTDSKTQSTAITYNNQGKIKTKTKGNLPINNNVDDLSQYLLTEMTYDSHGNLKSQTACSYHYASNCGTRAVPTDTASDLYKVFRRAVNHFDSAGRYVIRVSNGMFDTAMYESYNDLGLPRIKESATGLRSKTYYDDFGVPYFVGSETGEHQSTIRYHCNNSCDFGAQYYQVISSPNTPDVKLYFDFSGRKLLEKTQLFDGRWSEVQTSYNENGELVELSIPRFDNAVHEAIYFEYDGLGRKWREESPDGTVKTMSWSGLQESSNVRQQFYGQYSSANINLTTTKTLNGFGWMIKTSDANNNDIFYDYGALGKLTKATNMDGSAIVVGFDDYGRKLSLNDPSKGVVNYRYNAMDQVVERKSPANDYQRSYFDAIGRNVKQTTTSGSTVITGTYTFVGPFLESENSSEGIRKNFSFDGFGRLKSTTYNVDRQAWVSEVHYDSVGRVLKELDVSGDGRGSLYGYQNGYQIQISEASNPSIVYSKVTNTDARANPVQWTLGNGNKGLAIFDKHTGRIVKRQVKKGSLAIQNQVFEHDGLGNLRARVDLNGSSTGSPLVELFSYDDINRLDEVTLNGYVTLDMDYYDNGNIKSKSDMGAGADYRYGQKHGGCTSTPGNHALTSIGSAIRYCFDNKGNQTKSYLNGKLTRTVEYTGYDKPSEIKSDEGMTLFMYDAGHKRFKRIDRLNDKNTTTYYLGNVELVTHTSGLKEFKRYVGGNVIQTVRSNNANSLEYLHKDHLGSINFITDASGHLKHKLSFDAFGKRRNGATWSPIQKVYAAPSIKTILKITERGFTGHEHVDHANVIHMNGRIFDPETGRFMQADPIVQAPDNGQSFNRYSYVFNNPLSYTDPTGYEAATQQGGNGESIDEKVKQLQRKIRSYSGRIYAAPPKIRKALIKLAQQFGGLQNVKLKATSGGSVQNESQSSDMATTETSFDTSTNQSGSPSDGANSPTINLVSAAKQHFLKGTPLDKLGLSSLQAELMKEFGESLDKAFLLGDDLDASGYIEEVETKGDWDFKNRKKYKGMRGIEEFGNFAFGATSAAWAAGATNGISTLFKPLTANFAIRGAGFYQEYHQSRQYSPSNGHFYDIDIDVRGLRFGPLNPGTRFGDNSGDDNAILDGHIFFNSYYENR